MPKNTSIVDVERLAGQLDSLVGHEPAAIAVSGGSDSMALMHIAAAWRASGGSSDSGLTVLTVDHGLRPGSEREAASVAIVSEGLGLPHETLVWTGEKPSSGISAHAREARYRLMTRWCHDHGIAKLLVAHTLDDQAETVVMRLARGSGVDGLSAMAPVVMNNGVALIRPLLGVSRADLQAYLRSSGLSWIEDPTNEDTTYERVRIRKGMDALCALGVTQKGLATTARRLQRARAALDGLTTEALHEYASVHAAGVCDVSSALLADAPDEIVMRVLGRCLTAVGGLTYPPRQSALEALQSYLKDGHTSTRTLGGCQVVVGSGRIRIAREAGRVPAEPVGLVAGERLVWDGRFRVGYELASAASEQQKVVNVRPLQAAGWDMVKQNGAVCPVAVREGLVSFWQNEELVAVPHLGYRSDCAPQDTLFFADFCNLPLLEGAGAMDVLKAL